jgi:hypothetical protein
MTLRLTSCCAGALLFHAALLALGARPVPTIPPYAARTDEAEIELFEPDPLDPEPASPPTPAVSGPAPSPLPDLQPRVAARAPQPRSDVTLSSGAPAPEAASPAEPDTSAGNPAPRKRLSLEALGVTGSGIGAAFLQGSLDAPRGPTPDRGGLRQERMARDTELGIGPGGAVASAVRTPARELAPLGSEATFSVDLSADGSVVAVSLDGVTSDDTAWNALLRVLRERLASLTVTVGRPTRVTVLVTNRSTLRAGNAPGGPFQFDLSNIGSPTIQSLRVRVLAQMPL